MRCARRAEIAVCGAQGVVVSGKSHRGMVLVEGGAFRMGAARFYPEERPVRVVAVESFLIDEAPVTNADFRAFVADTGYTTAAERNGTGSAVFVRPSGPVDLADPSQWWRIAADACWHRPLGSESGLDELDAHPVVHVTYDDAAAYAAWAGRQLPTEAQWEIAARGGLDGADYAWGNVLVPDGLMLANWWQGEFPRVNTLADGWERTSPVRTFPANGYGLYDMIGNVWEWTSDRWVAPGETVKPACCSAPRVGNAAPMVIKGGSYLCAANYCQRYRPAARHPQRANESTGHIGFRCVMPA